MALRYSTLERLPTAPARIVVIDRRSGMRPCLPNHGHH